MAQQTLFSRDGIELKLTQEGDSSFATIILTVGDVVVEAYLRGENLTSFYQASRHLISRNGSLKNELLNTSKEDLITEVILYLHRKGVDAESFTQVYRAFDAVANLRIDNPFLSKIKVVGDYADSQVVRANVFIALPQEEIDIFTIELIQNATGDFMEALGFELEAQEEPVFGSFYQRLKYLLKGEVKTEAAELYTKGKTALELQFVSVPNAEATSKLAIAAASLITALNGIDEAAIRLGAILVVKVSRDGIPLILAETVSPEMALLLDKNPQLLKNPSVVFDLISTIQVPEKKIEESGSAEVVD